MDGAQLAAYVLHSRRYRDSSLLVDFLSREEGRIVCVARGALRPKSNLPVRQPFQPLVIEYRGRGEVSTLVRAEATAPPTTLSGRQLYCGLYLNELMLRLTARQDPHPHLFDDYAMTLAALQEGVDTERVLRRFEVKLLDGIGLGLLLKDDSQGQPVCADAEYTYNVELGPVRASDADRQTYGGATLLAMRSGDWVGEKALAEARRLMRSVLDHHLEGRPLRTRELFR